MSEKLNRVRKNGVLLKDTQYRLGSLRRMTKQELIEEILGTHEWGYLLEYGMVVKDEWTGRWCVKCDHKWDLNDPTTEPCECNTGVYKGASASNTEGDKMDCVCKKNKGMTEEECGFCICCEDYGNGVECDCE